MGPDGQPGGPNNSGISIDFQPNLAESEAQAHVAMAQAISSAMAYQREAAAFMIEVGPDDTSTMVQVGHPNIEGGAGDVGEGGDFGGAGNSDY